MKKSIKGVISIIDKLLNRVFMTNHFIKKNFLDVIEIGLNNCSTVLEIGAGKYSYLRLINRSYKITAIDVSEESLSAGYKNMIFDDIIVGNAVCIEEMIQPKSFDAVVAFDFIEHLEVNEGYEFLSKCEKIAKKAIVIFTPNGFLEQPASINNPFQEHKSGWTFNKMKELNYNVYGINGVKWLSGKYNIPRIKPISLGNLIRNISAMILRKVKLEKYSACILCIKRIENICGK